MDTKVHKVLQDAGVAKGLTDRDIAAWIALANDAVLQDVISRTQLMVEAGKLTQGERDDALALLAEKSKALKALLTSHAKALTAAKQKAATQFARAQTELSRDRLKKLTHLRDSLKALRN